MLATDSIFADTVKLSLANLTENMKAEIKSP